jgi:hypothetical protein
MERGVSRAGFDVDIGAPLEQEGDDCRMATLTGNVKRRVAKVVLLYTELVMIN